MCTVDARTDLIMAGDTLSGTGDNAPDYKLNAQIIIECADIVFPVLFYNISRLIVCIDSDMCKCALFAWFGRQAAMQRAFSAVALTDASLVAISGISSANYVQATTLGVWLVHVPEIDTCASHVVLVIFSFSSCYLCKKAKKFVASINHGQMQLVRALSLHPTRAWAVGVPLWCAVSSAFTPWLSEQLGVLVLTPTQW